MKKQKLSHEAGLPTSENDIFVEMYTEKKTEKKRKNGVISSDLTFAKKQKNSNVGLPITETVNYRSEKTVEPVPVSSQTVTKFEFSIGEIVWAKIRGWPHWPAKIIAIEPKRYEVFWFNDYRKSKIFRSQIYKFHDNFNSFSGKFTSSLGLETAAKEALIYLGTMNSK